MNKPQLSKLFQTDLLDYLNLIQYLLSCPSTMEEREILNAHRHLVSAELVLTMTTVAEMFRERGDKNAANSLVHVAHHIATELGLSSASASFQLPTLSEQLTFFVQVFQATEQRNGSSEAVYSLLQANLNLLGEYFAAMWKTWAITMVLDKNLEAAQGIAAVIGNFGVLINNFSLGNRAINLEIAIASYEINSTVFTRDAFPFEWANTQNNLGTVYCERIRGDRADNLQKAIDYLLLPVRPFFRELEKMEGKKYTKGNIPKKHT